MKGIEISMKRTFDIAPWHVATHKWDPQDKRLQESMTSLANENLGMRGFFEEGYSGDHMEGIYLGGVWFPDKTRVGWWKNGYPKYFGKMINAVNFMKLIIKVNGEQLDLAKQTPKDFKLDLDMKRGVLERRFTVEIGGTEMYFNFERFVSVTQKELVGQRLHIKNRGDSDAKVEITSMIDADVYNEDANYDEQFWNVLGKSADGEHAELTSMTKKNDFGTPQFIVGMKTTSKTNLDHVDDGTDEKHAYNTFVGTVAAGKEVNFEKRSIVMTSRDYDSQADIEKNLDVLGDQLDIKVLTIYSIHILKNGQIVGLSLMLKLKVTKELNRVFVSTSSNSSLLTTVKITVLTSVQRDSLVKSTVVLLTGILKLTVFQFTLGLQTQKLHVTY